MDLMSLTVEAGLDFTVALQRIINEMGRGILSDEYSEMLRQIQLGTPRKEALRDLANRCQVVSLTSCCSAIIQADEVGANLAPILKILSGTLREQRSTRAEELAGKAPVKMLAPLILCIFPCVFIIIFAPIFIKTVIGGPSM
jgi:tight adherence protein C